MLRHPLNFFNKTLLAMLLPLSVSAASFFPTANQDITLTSSTLFNFDSYTISPGIQVNYQSPTDSLIEIVSEGDIVIDGSLSLFGGTYSLTSSSGSIFINGTLDINADLIINSNVNVNAGTPPSGSGNNGLILGSGTTLTFAPTTTITGGPIINNTGTLILIPSPVILPPSTVTITFNQTVPVPPSLLLFLSGLVALALRTRFKNE